MGVRKAVGFVPVVTTVLAVAVVIANAGCGEKGLRGDLDVDGVMRRRVGDQPPDELTNLAGSKLTVGDAELRLHIDGVPACALPMTPNGASLELTRGTSCAGLGTLSWSALAIAHESGGYPRLVGTLVFSEDGATGKTPSMVVRWLFVDASKRPLSLH